MVEAHLPPVGRGECDGRNGHAAEVIGGAVVDGHWQPVGQRQRVVRSHQSIISGPPASLAHGEETHPVALRGSADRDMSVKSRRLDPHGGCGSRDGGSCDAVGLLSAHA